MPIFWILGLLGVGGFLWYRSQHPTSGEGPPSGFSPQQDAEVRKTVTTALVKEQDPHVLNDLAAKLAAAGYKDLAIAVENRAHQLAGLPPPQQGVMPAPNLPNAPQQMVTQLSMPVQYTTTASYVPAVVPYGGGNKGGGGGLITATPITSGGYDVIVGHDGTYPIIQGHGIGRHTSGQMLRYPGYRTGRHDLF